MARRSEERPQSGAWRQRLHRIIFESDTRAGKVFDIVLLVCITVSVLVVMLESVPSIEERHGSLLRSAEWVFTILFTIEYALRLISVRRPLRYATSFFGVVDLLGVLPSYFGLFLPGAQDLMVIRILRLVRVFRIFKMVRHVGEAGVLMDALRASRAKIAVFLLFVATVVVVIGAAMHLIEGPENGFTSIPRSMYWAIVTMTTVGYGDIAPRTPLGMALASAVMILGYGIIAVPTGIVSAELTHARRQPASTKVCPDCGRAHHEPDADFCRICGARLTG